MHLLAYTSKSTIKSADFDRQLDQIVAVSQRNNTKTGLTGVMFQHRQRFLQFLEGDHKDVMDTFERIQNDPRHSDVEILFDSPIRQRGCPDWSMDVFHIRSETDMNSEHLKMLSDNYCKNFVVQTDTILALFKGFIGDSMDFNFLSLKT